MWGAKGEVEWNIYNADWLFVCQSEEKENIQLGRASVSTREPRTSKIVLFIEVDPIFIAVLILFFPSSCIMCKKYWRFPLVWNPVFEFSPQPLHRQHCNFPGIVEWDEMPYSQKTLHLCKMYASHFPCQSASQPFAFLKLVFFWGERSTHKWWRHVLVSL